MKNRERENFPHDFLKMIFTRIYALLLKITRKEPNFTHISFIFRARLFERRSLTIRTSADWEKSGGKCERVRSNSLNITNVQRGLLSDFLSPADRRVSLAKNKFFFPPSLDINLPRKKNCVCEGNSHISHNCTKNARLSLPCKLRA